MDKISESSKKNKTTLVRYEVACELYRIPIEFRRSLVKLYKEQEKSLEDWKKLFEKEKLFL